VEPVESCGILNRLHFRTRLGQTLNESESFSEALVDLNERSAAKALEQRNVEGAALQTRQHLTHKTHRKLGY
jgi:hypothetical protein